jgi:hypothetical protein
MVVVAVDPRRLCPRMLGSISPPADVSPRSSARVVPWPAVVSWEEVVAPDVGGRRGRSFPLRPRRGWAAGAAAEVEESRGRERAMVGRRREGLGFGASGRGEGGIRWVRGGGRGSSQNVGSVCKRAIFFSSYEKKF